MKDYIITVMAQDRVGIVRDVSSAITAVSGNITHLSQTVLRGYFTLIISTQMPDERTQLEIRQAIERYGPVGEMEVVVRPYIDQKATLTDASERYTLSMQGQDQPGIIARTTAYLAERGVNVDDFYCYVHECKLLMLAQVAVPACVDMEELNSGLRKVGEDFGYVVHFQHEDIFRATSEVHPIFEL
jgi:predicted amino acid-binding ACT domain protein